MSGIMKGVSTVTAVAVASLGAAAPAVAAKHHRRAHHRHTRLTHAAGTTSTSGTSSSNNGETALTGSALSSASAAAVAANPGATVDGATTETDSSLSGAAYEVHITKADGTHAVVIEDSSFTVLATQSGGRCGSGGGRPGNGETALTGSALSSASAAAVAANPGATVDGATTETDSSLSGAAYEVHITKADGTHAVVIEDSSFTVLATQGDTGPPRH